MTAGRRPVNARLPERIARRLTIPLIAAPMLRVSGPELVLAACRAGVVGAFPTANPRSAAELEEWMARFDAELSADDAPYCPNLIMARDDIDADVDVLLRHNTEIVITSVGSPAPIMPVLREAGVVVLADVATLHHARKALEVGVDGLVLLGAGAGGNTGRMNPFAFVRAIREFYDGVVVMAGGMSDGQALYAAEVLGCDLAYMGTKFIASAESRADEAYRQMVVDSSMDDVVRTRAFTGIDTSMLVPSIVAAGLDPTRLDETVNVPGSRELYGGGGSAGAAPSPKRWKDIWSAGHSVSGVHAVQSVAQIVAHTRAEYDAARSVR